MADSEVKIKVAADAKGVAPALVTTRTEFRSLSTVMEQTRRTTEEFRKSTQGIPAPLQQSSAAAATATDRIRSLDAALKSAKPGLETLQSKGGEIAAGFGVLSGAFAGVAVGVAGFGGAVLKTAADFELLRGKLQAVIGDSEKAAAAFDNAVQKAATSPFDVQGVVKATISLETFGISAKENLDRVLNLGAAFGDLDNATLAFAKASAGSLEGFESLRNTYSFSTAKLKEFGGAVDDTGQVMVRTEKQIAQNREALARWIDLKFGGAVEAQANTLRGAFSNLLDSLQLVANGFGEILIPAATATAKGLGSVLGSINNLSSGAKTAIVAVVAVAGGLAALGAAATAAIAGLGLFAAAIGTIGLGLEAMSTAATAAILRFPALGLAIDSTSAAITRYVALARAAAATNVTFSLSLGTFPALFARAQAAAIAFGTSAVSSLTGAAVSAARFGAGFALALGPLNIVLAGLGAAAYKAISDYEDGAEKLGKTIKAMSTETALANGAFRSLSTDMEKAFGVTTDFSGGLDAAHANLEALNKALADKSPAQAADALAGVGRSVESLKTDLQASKTELEAVKVKYKELLQIRSKITFEGGVPSLRSNATDSERKTFEALGKDVKVLDEALKSTKLNLSRVLSNVLQFETLSDKVTPLSLGMQDASKAATELDGYLKFAGRSEDIGTLTTALDAVGVTLDKARSKYAKFAEQGKTSTADLIERLRSAKDPDTIKAIEDILALEQEREKISDALTKQKEKEAKASEDAVKDELEAKTRLLDDDKKGLLQRLALIDQALGKVRDGSEAEKQLHRDKAATLEKLEQTTTKTLVDEVKKRQDAVSNSVEAERARVGSSASTVATVAREGVVAIEAWGKANADALKASPALMEAYTSALARANDEFAKAKAAKVEDTFKRLNDGLQATIDKADAAPEKLAAVQAAIKAIETDSKSAKSAADKEAHVSRLKDLKAQELQITKEIDAAERALAGEVAQLRVSAIQNEIRLLEARKAAGEKVDGALAKSKGDLQKARIEQIDKEAAQAKKDGEDPTLVDERAALKKKAIEAEITYDAYQEKQQRLKDAKKTADDEVSIEQDKRGRIQRVAQQSASSTPGPTGPGATVDRQTGNYGGTSAFGVSGNSSGPVSGFGSFFDNFGTNNRTIDRSPQSSSSPFAYQDDATFKAGLPKPDGAFLPTPNGLPTFSDNAARIQYNIDQNAKKIATQRAESGAITGTNPANRPTNIGSDGKPLANKATQPAAQTTVNDSRTVIINMQGGGSLTPNPNNAKAIKQAVDDETKFHSFFDGSGRNGV